VSLVSSEHAFSQGGITISKRQSCLKGDIIEALQCIKCVIYHDLLFCKMGPSSVEEEKYDDVDDVETGDFGESKDNDNDEQGWAELFLEDDDLESNINMNEDIQSEN
jgi:hypothetical protein